MPVHQLEQVDTAVEYHRNRQEPAGSAYSQYNETLVFSQIRTPVQYGGVYRLHACELYRKK